MTDLVTSDLLSIRDEGKREIEARLVPWGVTVETNDGLEEFHAGSFEGIEPSEVVLRLDHSDPAGGRGLVVEERDDGAYGVLRADTSARGQQILDGVRDGTYRSVSVGFEFDKGRTRTRVQGGRKVWVHDKSAPVQLREVSPTWRPAYKEAAILAVRSEDETPMAEPTPVTEAVAPSPAIASLLERIDQLEERSRQAITVPELTHGAMSFTTDRTIVAERALANIVTTGNEGVVPDAAVNEIIGIIDRTRPFLDSTRRLPTPSAGMNLVVPKITQRPLVAEQMAQKDELASRATIITTVEWPFRTFGGAADLSLQLIKRSSPEYLPLFLELLAEAYAIETEEAAIAALLADADLNAGTAVFSPDDGNISFGESFINAQATSPRLFPDTLWLSTAAVAQMIDAKTDGTNQPLFGNIALNADANGGVNGSVSGLRAVHVPSLDATAVDAIVGPRRGFTWAEDGTYTLTADVPSKAGRDVGIVGLIAFGTWYPAAFTTYALAV